MKLIYYLSFLSIMISFVAISADYTMTYAISDCTDKKGFKKKDGLQCYPNWSVSFGGYQFPPGGYEYQSGPKYGVCVNGACQITYTS